MARFASDLLQRLRLDLGLTQEAAARTLGVDVRTYRRYERGTVNEAGFEVRTAGRRRFLAALSAEFGVGEEEWILEDPTPAPAPAVDRIVRAHALQPARHFVGRSDLLARLRRWVAGKPPESGPRLIAISGVGGAGKTAVVEELLHDHAPAGLTFVWSLYEEPRAPATAGWAWPRPVFCPCVTLSPEGAAAEADLSAPDVAKPDPRSRRAELPFLTAPAPPTGPR